MRIINRTIYGSALQTALMFELPLDIKINTTLNEKFNILENFTLEPGVLPKVGYFCIGNGGHKVITGADGIPYTSPIGHRSSDAALFNHMPFVIRDIDNDLTIAAREQYALRTEIEVNGEPFIAYYLKRIDLSLTEQVMEHSNVIAGQETTKEFIPDESMLSPTHPEIPNTGVITTDGNYLSTSALIVLNFDDEDVAELINVSNIMYGNSDRAIISEIGLCSGIDKVTSANYNTGQINYREAIAVQVVSFVTGYYPVGYSNRGFELSIEAGATEPLLGLSG